MKTRSWPGWVWVVGLLRALAFVVAIAGPAALLFDLKANFYYDWHNHQWLVGYSGEFFRRHMAMPDTLAVGDAIGMPQPVFYGFLLYPILGALASLTGAALALRIGILVAFASMFTGVYLAGRATLGHRGLSYAIAVAATWSTYGLTNLYNRAALPEFFSVAFLTAATGFGAVAVAHVGRGGFASFSWLAGGFAILAAGTHPPTALVSAGFIGLLLLTLFWLGVRAAVPMRPTLATGVLLTVIGGVILAPWIYANAQLYAGLGVVGKYRDFSFTPDGCDSWAARFSPLPYDPATGANPLAGPGTPYIEAPLIFALIIVGGWFLFTLARANRRRDHSANEVRLAWWIASVAAGWFALMLALSLSPGFAAQFRFLAPYVQFGTRFVSHANIGLLVIVLASGAVLTKRGGLKRFPWQAGAVAALALLVATAGVVIKLQHAAVVRQRGDEPQYAFFGDRTRLVSPGRPDAAGDYAVGGGRPQLLPLTVERAQRANFPVGHAGSEFGRPREAKVFLERTGWVITNAVMFPWSVVTVDDRIATTDMLALNQYRVALRLPEGEHVLRWAWQPPSTWSRLRIASWGALIFLLAGMAKAACFIVIRRLNPKPVHLE